MFVVVVVVWCGSDKPNFRAGQVVADVGRDRLYRGGDDGVRCFTSKSFSQDVSLHWAPRCNT